MLCGHAPIRIIDMMIAYWQMEADVTDVKEQLAQTLFDHIPVGVGSQGIISTSAKDLEAALEMGMDWSLREVGPSPSLPSHQGLPAFLMSCCLHRMLQHLFSVLGIRHEFGCTQIYCSSMPVIIRPTRQSLFWLCKSVLRSDKPPVDMYTDHMGELLLSSVVSFECTEPCSFTAVQQASQNFIGIEQAMCGPGVRLG